MPAPKLSEGQYQEIAELIERGVPDPAIAERFGISIGAVQWTGLRLGADRPPHLRRSPGAKPSRYERGGHVVRTYTPGEDARLLDMERAGNSYAHIARSLGRGTSSIRGRLLTLARQEARAEDA